MWTTQKLSFHLDTSSEICKCLKKLWRKNAHNIDKLPQNLLQDVGNKISKPIVPNLWRISKVTPLYKSDSKSDFSNYRPISVLTCLSKVLEQVIHYQLSNHLEKHHLLAANVDSMFMPF